MRTHVCLELTADGEYTTLSKCYEDLTVNVGDKIATRRLATTANGRKVILKDSSCFALITTDLIDCMTPEELHRDTEELIKAGWVISQ